VIYLKILKIPGYLYRSIKNDLGKISKYKSSRPPKVAFCLYGIVGGTKGKAGDKGNETTSEEILNKGYQHYKKHIFDQNENVDVFIHTWSTDSEEDICDLYSPKKSIFQKQMRFDIPSYVKGEFRRKQNHYSRWYSTKKVIELKSQYEKENNFEYDLVFITRFDVAWQKQFDFSKFDPLYFYVANCFQVKPLWGLIPLRYGYPYQKEGLADLWFLSNSSYMETFASLYDHLGEYTKPGRCPYSLTVGISNHKLASYHLKQTGLISKLRFVFEHLSQNEVDPLIRKKYFDSKK
jgi:hypothetical protein